MRAGATALLLSALVGHLATAKRTRGAHLMTIVINHYLLGRYSAHVHHARAQARVRTQRSNFNRARHEARPLYRAANASDSQYHRSWRAASAPVAWRGQCSGRGQRGRGSRCCHWSCCSSKSHPCMATRRQVHQEGGEMHGECELQRLNGRPNGTHTGALRTATAHKLVVATGARVQDQQECCARQQVI
jgi:hypothetical protein